MPFAKIKMGLHDSTELLANLDFVIEKIREHSGRPGRADVLQKLQPRLSKRQTVRQIESKLKSLNGDANPKAMVNVYRYGSSRMKSLDAGLKHKVQEKLKIIKSEEVCIVVSTPRRLRSLPRDLTTETSRSKRESTAFSERTTTRTLRKTRRGQPQAQVFKLAENEPLSSKVRNRFETWEKKTQVCLLMSPIEADPLEPQDYHCSGANTLPSADENTSLHKHCRHRRTDK
jgi:hypothetical protein